ncbi:histidinol-phosphate aminotransferase [Frankineae bacterium MT45]|nr:histidinol-phosphate aminotransferase [Frankineae bacterium MT45]
MLRRLDLTTSAPADLRRVLPRAKVDVAAAMAVVEPVVNAVSEHGYAAARDATRRFDGVDVAEPRVARDALRAAADQLDPQVRDALVESIRRAKIGHNAQRREDVTTQVVPGGTVTERWIAVGRVGLYVPGGLAVYPSSVVMNVVPAQVAGVNSIAVFSPAQKEFGGLPHPTILAACELLGVDEVYAIGGAQAIAVAAYGDAELGIEPVDLVTGPGNIYVAAAKRLLRGVIGIDAEAGPTEIAILADATADPVHVAADLISQAEHDPLAASVLVTDSAHLADLVDVELSRQVGLTKHTDRMTAALQGEQSATVIVRDLEQGLAVVDAYAAEHLEVITRDARHWAERVRNAGCIFVGPDAPVSLGDYCAGSNHVLPTGCTARHASGLSVQSFLKGVHLVEYTHDALVAAAPFVLALSNAEDLPAHGAAVSARLTESDSTAPATPGDASYDVPLRPELRGETPYGAPQLDVAVQLNVNENPYAPSARVAEEMADAVRRAAGELNRYPDRDAVALRDDLAAYLGHGLTGAQVWAANGSNEIMVQLLQAFGGPGRTALSFAPTYSMYPEYARDTHTRWVVGQRAEDFTIELDAALALIGREAPSVTLLASPNNPTGTALPLQRIEAICTAAQAVGGVVVVDEAYGEFRRAGTPSALELLPRFPNLVVTRTMSKAFALAGGRLGYLAASTEIVDAVRIVRLPYHLSAVSQAVARVALANSSELLARVDELRTTRDETAAWLRSVGLTAADSDANFVLFGGFAPDRHQVWQELLDRGVLIREVGPPGWLRVSIGTPAEMARFRDALTAVLNLPMKQGETT